MKTVDVVAAVIKKGDKVLATQRASGKFRDFWEFPGGKIEPGEAAEDALRREIREELSAEIRILDTICKVEHRFDHVCLDMQCFLCELESSFVLLEHKDAIWLTRAELPSIDWLDSDRKAVNQILKTQII